MLTGRQTLFALPLLVTHSFVAAAQTIAFDPVRVPVAGSPQALVVGDFNRDGKPDFAVAIQDAGSVAIEALLGNGDGTFHPSAPRAIGCSVIKMVTADFNRDGLLDLAVLTSGGAGHLLVLLGKGDGSFQPPVDLGITFPAVKDYPVFSGPLDVAVGDIDGDGNADLVVGPYTAAFSSVLTVMRGNGDGTFQAQIPSPSLERNDNPSVAVSDLGGNGRSDAMFTGSAFYPPNQDFGVFLGNQDGSLELSYLDSDRSYEWGSLAMGDWNGNGRPDAAALRQTGPSNGSSAMEIAAFLDGSTTPVITTVRQNLALNGYDYSGIASADVDGDGKLDLVLSDLRANLYVLRGKGDGTFETAPIALYSGLHTVPNMGYIDPSVYGASLAIADFRGMGRPDIVVLIPGAGISFLKNTPTAAPAVSAAGVVNAANPVPGPVAPGSVVSLFGSGLAYDSGLTPIWYGSPQSPMYSPVETLFGLRVTLNGFTAPILYASPSQANVVVPWDLAGQTQATLVMTRNGATQSVTVPIAAYAPALFTTDSQGSGQAVAEVCCDPDSHLAAPLGAFPGSRPARRGELVTLFGTGLGPIDTGLHTTSAPTVTVGGVSAGSTYAPSGPANYQASGLYSVTFLIPDAAPVGDSISVVLSIGGVTANTVTIAVQ